MLTQLSGLHCTSKEMQITDLLSFVVHVEVDILLLVDLCYRDVYFVPVLIFQHNLSSIDLSKTARYVGIWS